MTNSVFGQQVIAEYAPLDMVYIHLGLMQAQDKNEFREWVSIAKSQRIIKIIELCPFTTAAVYFDYFGQSQPERFRNAA